MPSLHARTPAIRGSWPLARARTACALLVALALAGCDGESNEPEDPTDEPHHTTLVPATSEGFVEARTSQIVSDGSGPSQVFDDFELDNDATVGTIGWQGIFCVQSVGAAAPAPTATHFTIALYPDASGLPNLAAPLHTSTHAVAQTHQTFERNVDGLFCGTSDDTSWAFYRYSVDLASPISIAEGTRYWISIQAHTPSYAVYFGWRDGLASNNNSIQLFDGDYTTYPVDRAYSLEP